MKNIVIAILIFLFSSIALAVTYDVTGDSQVDIDDVVVLAENWLQEPVVDPNCDFNGDGDIDFIDYSLLIGNWSGEYPTINTAPIASGVEVSAYTAEVQGIDFVVSDADGDVLTYKIQSLPSHGKLTDINISSGYIYTTPYEIQNNLNCVTYTSDTGYTGADSFTYTAYDGSEDANTATVDIDVVVNTLDNLTFNGQGYVTVADANEIEFDSDFTFALWFKTQWPYGVLFSKRASSGAGIEGRLVAGRPVVSFFDTSGNVKTLSVSSDRYYKCNTGEWTHLIISHNKDGNFPFESDTTLTSFIYINTLLVASSNDIFDCDFYNNANFIIGSSMARGFKGEIDRVSWYSSALSSFSIALVNMEGRNGAANALTPAYYTRFDFDEGSGTTLNDTTHGLTGTINSADDVQWVPGNAVGQNLSPKLRGRERFRPDTFHFRDYRGSNGY